MIMRIIDKKTSFFIRDDSEYNHETEIALNVNPPYALYRPYWNGEEWLEGLSQSLIEERKASTEPQAPTMEQMAIALMQTQTQLQDAQNALDFLIMGGI